MNSYAQNVLERLQKNCSHQKEFMQSVSEVLGSLSKLLDRQDKYEKYCILERLVMPERIIVFQVPWMDDRAGGEQIGGMLQTITASGYRGNFISVLTQCVNGLPHCGAGQTQSLTHGLSGAVGSSGFLQKGKNLFTRHSSSPCNGVFPIVSRRSGHKQARLSI